LDSRHFDGERGQCRQERGIYAASTDEPNGASTSPQRAADFLLGGTAIRPRIVLKTA